MIKEKSEIKDAINHARKFTKIRLPSCRRIHTGLQISTESIFSNGICSTPGFADRLYNTTENFHPLIIENGGWVPSILKKNDIKDIKSLIESASKFLGINSGISKGDIVLHSNKGPMIIEIAARLSGGDFSESLVPLSSGVNYVKEAIKICIGKEVDWFSMKPTSNFVLANRYFFIPPGKLSSVKNIELIEKMDEVVKIKISHKIGSNVKPIESHSDRGGVFIVNAESRKLCNEVIRFVYEKVKFKINGKWVTGNPLHYNLV